MNTVSFNINDSLLTIETGRMAKQADGSVVVRLGDTMILVTVVATHKRSDRDFFSFFVPAGIPSVVSFGCIPFVLAKLFVVFGINDCEFALS